MESTRPTSSLQNTSPGMDPAEVSKLLSTIEYQNDLLKGFQAQFLTLQAANEHLTQYICSLPAQQPDQVSFVLPEKNVWFSWQLYCFFVTVLYLFF